ncbi:zinc finger SWIM domain-containing protein 1 [Lacerta agilis]|uniref:zinc finger SWIM domain-containing protein 1 n=1 Tax=Lacerta agilis TaxID=80427 RepID=UPI001419803F|nr:zinc finger SWIM domain-containing protein 1 [Lacerta agilis]
MALETVKELLSFDCGLLVAYQVYKSSQLDSISFQTSQMRDVFLHHPEVVLIHRTHNPWGKALYMFMVDQPFMQLEGEMTKVIHFAVPTRESAEGLAQMYRTFKAFNPEWKQIKTFLVDPHFRWLPALSEAFPSVDVQLSVFHICKHLQHKIQQVSLEAHTEKLVLSALRNAMCAPSESNLRKLYTILCGFVKPNRLPQLHKEWLLNEKIWAFHRWRTWGQCSQYFKDLEMVTHSLSQIFCEGPSLDTSITKIARSYQKVVQKSSAESVPGPGLLLGENGSSIQNLLVLRCSAANSQRLLLPKDSAPTAAPTPLKLAAGVAAEESAREEKAEVTSREAEEWIKQSLSNICTEPAARLCLNEFAVVQSSLQLMGNNGETASIQILEDAQVVRQRGLNSCTCHFSQTFQLPCRHVLAVLNSEGKDFEPGRIPARWRKGNSISQEGQSSTDGLLEVPSCPWNELLDKYLAVSFLTAEISRLLSQCSHEEFDRRYSTLRELADSWIGPYVQVKL